MFDFLTEEKEKIEKSLHVCDSVNKELSIESERVKKEWYPFLNLAKAYKHYVKIVLMESIEVGYKDLNIIFAGSNLILTIDYINDNFYIVKKIKKMFKKREYVKVATIETWSQKSISTLEFDYNYLAEIEQLYQELKQNYKEKIESEIQEKTVKLETLKLICPNFN